MAPWGARRVLGSRTLATVLFTNALNAELVSGLMLVWCVVFFFNEEVARTRDNAPPGSYYLSRVFVAPISKNTPSHLRPGIWGTMDSRLLPHV